MCKIIQLKEETEFRTSACTIINAITTTMTHFLNRMNNTGRKILIKLDTKLESKLAPMQISVVISALG